MQVLECEHDLSGVEAGVLLCVAAGLAQMREHFAAAHILENHVQIGVVLEARDELDYERKVDGAQDLLLVERVLDLLHLDYIFLLEHLHGIALRAVGARVNDHDSAEAARADCAVELEVVQLGHRLRRRLTERATVLVSVVVGIRKINYISFLPLLRKGFQSNNLNPHVVRGKICNGFK